MAKNSFFDAFGKIMIGTGLGIAAIIGIRSCEYTGFEQKKEPIVVESTKDASNTAEKSIDTIVEDKTSKSDKKVIPPTSENQTIWSFYRNSIEPFDKYKGTLDILFVDYTKDGVKTQRTLENINFDAYMKLIGFGENLPHRPNKQIGHFNLLTTNIDGHKYLLFNPSISGGTASYEDLSDNIEAIATRETKTIINRRTGKQTTEYSRLQGAIVTIDGNDYLDQTLNGKTALFSPDAVKYGLRQAMKEDKKIIVYVSESDNTTQTAIVEPGYMPTVDFKHRFGSDISLLLGQPDSAITDYIGRERNDHRENGGDDNNNPTSTPLWNPDPTDRNKKTDEQESKPNSYTDITSQAGYDSNQDVGTFPNGRP